jgi:hypothetical protein
MTQKTNKIRQTKESLIQALEKTLGVVTPACKQVGIHRSTFYEYYKTDDEFKQRVDDMINLQLDFSESKLFKLIEDNHPPSVHFHLKYKGQSRGYAERQEVTVTEKKPLSWFDEKD